MTSNEKRLLLKYVVANVASASQRPIDRGAATTTFAKGDDAKPENAAGLRADALETDDWRDVGDES